MYCTPSTGLQIIRVKPRPVVKEENRLSIIEAAYKAVDKEHYKHICHALQKVKRLYTLRSMDEIWSQGPGVVYNKTRVRSVVLMRQLLIYYFYHQGHKERQIVEFFNRLHRTTILNARDRFADQLSLKYDTVEKSIWAEFLRLNG